MFPHRPHRLVLLAAASAAMAGICAADEPVADERLSEAADRDAAILALATALDQTMLLSDAQRDDMLGLLSTRWQGTWRTPRTWHGLIYPGGTPWQSAMTRAAFAMLGVQESELESVLRPAQLAVYHELRVYATAIRHRNVIAPRGPKVLLDLSLDDVAAVCELTEEQRTRLRLTGKSDVNLFLQSADWAGRHRRANEKDPAAPTITGPSLPAGTLPGDLSRYRKALEQWLTAEQRQRLRAAHHRRRRLERQAELAAIVRVIRRDAALSEPRCARLSDWLEERLGEPSPCEDAVSVRVELLVALSRLAPDEVARVVGEEPSAIAEVWKKLRTELRHAQLAESNHPTQ